MANTKIRDATATTADYSDLIPISRPNDSTARHSTIQNVGKTALGSNFFNVEYHGAVHDDSTDDTAAIQAAIDAAHTAGGGTVFLPAGTYRVSDNVYVRAQNIRIIGEGRGSIIKWADGTSTKRAPLYITENGGVTPSNIEIANLCIDGNVDNVTDTHGLIEVRANNVLIRNCWFLDPEQDFVYLNGDGTTAGTAMDVRIVDNYGHNAGRIGFVLIECQRVLIEGNTLVNCNTGHIALEPNNADEDVRDVVINGNTFTEEAGSTAPGFYSTGDGTIERVVVSNNTFVLNVSAIKVAEHSKYFNVIGNSIITTTGTTDVIQISSADYVNVSTNIVTMLDGATSHGGIGLTNANWVTVANNIIENSDNEGIVCGAGCSNSIVIGNIVKDAGGIGIMMRAEGSVCEGNVVLDSTGDGIVIYDITDFICKNNYVEGAGDDGIYSTANDSSRGVIEGNICKNSVVGSGMRVRGDYINISNNHCYDDQGTKTQLYGIEFDGADYVTVMGNDFTGNKTASTTGTPSNYRPNPDGTFANDLADYNFV